MAGSWIRSLIQGDSLTQRWLDGILTIGTGRFTFGRQASQGRLNITGVDLVQLLDVGDDFRNLRREHSYFIVRDFQVCELSDFFDVGFRYRHGVNRRSARRAARLSCP